MTNDRHALGELAKESGWQRRALDRIDIYKKGMRGGLFVNREAALRYVRSENGSKPQAILIVTGELELDLRSCSGHIKSAATSRHKLAQPASRW